MVSGDPGENGRAETQAGGVPRPLRVAGAALAVLTVLLLLAMVLTFAGFTLVGALTATDPESSPAETAATDPEPSPAETAATEETGPDPAAVADGPTVGECFVSPEPAGTAGPVDLQGMELVSCREPHDLEIFAILPHPGEPNQTFPGDVELNSFAAPECAVRFSEYVEAGWFESGYGINPGVPDRDGWRTGDRTIRCTLMRLDGQRAERSARAAGSIVPEGYVSFLRLNEGDCFDATDWTTFGAPVSCRDPHDLEAYAVLTSPAEPGAAHSGLDEVSSYAAGACQTEFASRVDPELAANLNFGPIAFPVPATWEVGHRTYICALQARDLTKLTGSQQLAHTQFETLSVIESPDRTAIVTFPDFASIAGLELVGSAHQANQTLALTFFAEHTQRGAPFEDERAQRGAVWFGERVPVVGGFETAFVFQLEMYSWFTIGDGFAFVIQGDSSNALGEGIGYDGIPNSVAIEFDTLREEWLSDPASLVPDAPDLLANHVSVHTRDVEANDIHTRASLGWANLEPVVLANRAAHVALIRYVPGELTVFVDEFETPVLTVDIDLAETLQLDDGSAYVGFTASSGPNASRGPRTSTITGHKIHGWELASAASR